MIWQVDLPGLVLMACVAICAAFVIAYIWTKTDGNDDDPTEDGDKVVTHKEELKQMMNEVAARAQAMMRESNQQLTPNLYNHGIDTSK